MSSDRSFLAFVMLFAATWLVAFPGFAQTKHVRLDEPASLSPDYNYANPQMPDHIRALDFLDNTPAENPVTDEGAHLGRVLFHDRQLSKNGLVSCASCHTAAIGFDDQTRFSIGFSGQITRRAAMPLANARFNPRGRYFWDERAPTLEDQVLDPLTDPIEMGLMPKQAISRISSRPWYPPLFEAAFGDNEVTDQRIAAALAQFVRTLISQSSPYDKAKASAGPDTSATEPFPEFNPTENRGKFLFFADRSQGGVGCSSCHETDAFVMLRPRNNGLPPSDREIDNGLGEITGETADNRLFRAASLKNIEKTAPYMHDGRFASLDEVIEHYSGKIEPHPNLSAELRNPDGSPIRLNLDDQDKAALIAFLNSLTDEEMMADERFSDPFILTTN
ncbi:MAG: cytochrome c peroxidase [Pseudomonadota bacterium]